MRKGQGTKTNPRAQFDSWQISLPFTAVPAIFFYKSALIPTLAAFLLSCTKSWQSLVSIYGHRKSHPFHYGQITALLHFISTTHYCSITLDRQISNEKECGDKTKWNAFLFLKDAMQCRGFVNPAIILPELALNPGHDLWCHTRTGKAKKNNTPYRERQSLNLIWILTIMEG